MEAVCIGELDAERQGHGMVETYTHTVMQAFLGLAGGFAAADAVYQAVESWRACCPE